MSIIDWEFVDDGQWEGRSACCASDEGDHFHYRIAVTEQGFFDVGDSDEELAMGREMPIATLAEAKAICVAREREIIKEAKSSKKRSTKIGSRP